MKTICIQTAARAVWFAYDGALTYVVGLMAGVVLGRIGWRKR